MPEILAFRRTGRISNGRLEGTNNKLGVLKRSRHEWNSSGSSVRA